MHGLCPMEAPKAGNRTGGRRERRHGDRNTSKRQFWQHSCTKIGAFRRFQRPDTAASRRLEFAAFSVKSMPMGLTGNGIAGRGRGGQLRHALVLALILAGLLPVTVSAQMFSDRPPPVPPNAVPDAPSGPAMNLAPPSGPGSGPVLPPTLTQPTLTQPNINQPSLANTPPVAPPPGAAAPGQQPEAWLSARPQARGSSRGDAPIDR